MKKLLKKKVNVFGKGIPVLAIFVLGIALVSAALITSWGTITGLVTVDQGFQVGGKNWDGDQVQWDATLTSLEEKTVSSGDYSLKNNAEVDAEIQFTTTCDETGTSDGCDDVITTEMVKLSVTGFTGGDEWDNDHYKKTYYNSPVTALSDLLTVDYSFEIIERTGFADTSAPYVVLVSNAFPLGAAVYIIPDGNTYNVGTPYTGVIDGSSKFHVPGDVSGSNCANQDYATGCTLNDVKAAYPDATLTHMSYAIGSWSGKDNSISAWMGIDKINNGRAVHKYLVISEGEPSSLKIVANFPKMMKPDEYTFITEVQPYTA